MSDDVHDARLEELLPCPFCGDVPCEYSAAESYVRIGCTCEHSPSVVRPTRAEAIAAWNRRSALRRSEMFGTAMGALYRIAQGLERPEAAARQVLANLGWIEAARAAGVPVGWPEEPCEVCGEPAIGGTQDDVYLCRQHAPPPEPVDDPRVKVSDD